MSLAARARAGVAWTSLGSVGGALVSLLQVAVAARFLERRDFGLVALVILVIGFAEKLADAGLNDALLHFRDPDRRRLSAVFWISVGVGLGLCALVAASSLLCAAFWGEPELAGLLCAASLVFVLAGPAQVSASLLRRALRFEAVAALDLVRGVASLLVVVWLAVAGHGAWALVWGLVAGQAARTVLALCLGARHFLPSFDADPSGLRPVLRFGGYQLGERLVNFAAWNTDKFVIGAALGTEALGLYSLAYQLVSRPFQLLATVSGRVMSALLGTLQHDRERVLDAFLLGLRATALIAVPVYVGGYLLAEPLVALVYGPGWGEVVGIFQILCPLGALYALGSSDGALVVATGKARVTFLWNCFSALVHAVAVLVGLRWGLHGVAFAVLLATAVVLLPCAFYVRWVLIRMPALGYLRCLARPLAYGALMGGCVRVLLPQVGGLSDALVIGLLAAAGAAVYAGMLWAFERPFLGALRGS